MYLEMAAIFPILDFYSCIATKWTRHMGKMKLRFSLDYANDLNEIVFSSYIRILHNLHRIIDENLESFANISSKVCA